MQLGLSDDRRSPPLGPVPMSIQATALRGRIAPFENREMQDTIFWPGQSGTEYKYWIHPIDTTFRDEPGNYIFAKLASPGRYSPLYIGQTGNLGDRQSTHEKEKFARDNGATHILVHVNRMEYARLAEEADLIANWTTPCNGR